MNDLKPHKHGDEGAGATHSSCDRHFIGGESTCCACTKKKNCGDSVYVKVEYAPKESAIRFQKCFNHISPVSLDEIMEWLSDADLLSDNGEKFRTEFWRLFIKE